MKNFLPTLLVLCASYSAYGATVPISNASTAHISSPVSKSSAPLMLKANALQWDHRGHVRLCAQTGAKNCTVAAIPPGIKNKDIINIVRTRVVSGATYDVVIMSHRGVYLCASGIAGSVKLLCQRMPVPDSSIATSSPSPDMAAATTAHLQNTVSLLTNRGMAAPVNRADVIAVGGGGCGYDEETGEEICEGGGGGSEGGGEDPASYTDIPDPGNTSPDTGCTDADAEAIAGPVRQ